MPRITLQNSRHRKGVIVRSVRFHSNGNLLEGALYLPEAAAEFPAVVVTGAWITVKEQMAGTYCP